ncbi:MAG: adenylate/guanylate cyclase domain-containing protein [Gaiellaceae bacterium MAG52_C11]|nr:adenylate/guanylate cyclase domain-containing protein [Candidatus Gaiellasilicea maunaloa]
MRDLPTGTVTLLFTDVEGSTRLLRELGAERFADALVEHRRVVREACEAQNGVEVDTQGDAFFVAFPTAAGALAAAVEITKAFAAGPIRVRIGMHTGTPLLREGAYVGADVHLAARVAAAAHGGQVLLSAATAALVAPRDLEPQAVALLDLGEHRLKDIEAAVGIFQLESGAFPPLNTISNTNLPRPASSFVGRERELVAVLARLAGGVRLLTLTGPGGAGKTRLAVEAAASLIAEYKAGVFWVGLAALRDPVHVIETVAQALGAKDGLAAHVGERELLVVIDNFEQVVDAAPELSALLSACPNLTLIVTSRELLRLHGEVEFTVPPLADSEAVALFCERAQVEPSDEIAELCARLDSLPLAVELAAARTRALTPAQILQRLSHRLDLLEGGRDADPRQETLRATVEWSYDLLSEDEQRLLRRLSVFAGGCTLEAAEAVVDADIDTLQSLIEKSLLRFSGERYWLLETIRQYAEEQLEPAESAVIRRRHGAYMVALAQASAGSLHDVSESAASARLAPDYANVRAAVSDAFAAEEPDDVGRILGALYPFLISHGHLAEAHQWTEAALAARDRLSDRGLAETLMGGGEIARFAGDFGLAIELKEELASVQGDLQRPNWRAATQADLCEIALDQGDFARARRYAEQSAEGGGGARATLCFAELALREGDLPSAEANGIAALADLEEGAFNHATCLELLGETARRSGDEAHARERFSAALRSFVELGDGGGIADCLDGLSRLAVAAGDGGRAGRLRGAAQQLRLTRGRRPIRADLPFPDPPESAQDEGRDLTLEEAVEYALGPKL